MNTILESWEDDINYVQKVSKEDSLNITEELEEEFCQQVWELWQIGVSKELARILSYNRIKRMI
jgi:hypothetical protein